MFTVERELADPAAAGIPTVADPEEWTRRFPCEHQGTDTWPATTATAGPSRATGPGSTPPTTSSPR
jgi:hypothetical protein